MATSTYARQSHARHGFFIGSLELDIALTLVPFVSAFGAIAYDPKAEVMRLSSFTVDGGLWGADEHALFESSVVDASGMVLGKFDVPFGISYLHYSAPDNRLVTQPAIVAATHRAWNDVGVQLYLSAPLIDILGYVVNGSGLPEVDAENVSAAAGGRLGFKPFGKLNCGCALAFGASAAHSFGPAEAQVTLLGLDVSAQATDLEVSAELIQLRDAAGAWLGGFYSQGVHTIDPIFLGGRYAVTSHAARVTARTLTGILGLEIFTRGELRLAYERGLDEQNEMLLVQIAGGTSWKPTGLRR
ncbi:MAG TPA: hypothetical protein VJN18_23920 [Polyangiaceae bacterium]|nr:hypothetical protein [Polyangiaceae bacterium]